MEVPLMVLVALLEVYHADLMRDPGAIILTHVPKLEKELLASSWIASSSLTSVEPTVTANGSEAGLTFKHLDSHYQQQQPWLIHS